MQRRLFLGSAALGLPALPLSALAHHGWGSFDATQPIFLQGKATRVTWANPHAELVLTLDEGLALPADLPQRALPAQSAALDGAAVLARTRLPRRADKAWEVELAPLSRLQAWKVPEIKPGESVAVVGYTFPNEQGKAVLRAEYLFSGGGVYGLRSSPV